MLSAFPDLIRTVLAFVVVLGVLVFIHELGHYLAARWRGVHVEAFSVGFGRALTQWTDKKGTVWKVAWLPLGGYVKLHGQERPQDVSPEVRASWLPGQTFHDKSVGSRAIIVAAGPIANFLLAMVLFAILFMVSGRPITVPVVGEVLPDGAAARGGMVVEDRIKAINGETIRTFEDIQRIVSANPAVRLAITVERDGGPRELSVLTDSREANGRKVGLLGIRGGRVEYQSLGPIDAIVGGITQTWTVTLDTLSGVGQMIMGSRGTEELGGPLRIAQLSEHDLVHRRPVGKPGPYQSVPDPRAGWWPSGVLSGRGHSWPAAVPTGAGIWLSGRYRPAGRVVRICDLERPDPYRLVPLGGRPHRLIDRGGKQSPLALGACLRHLA